MEVRDGKEGCTELEEMVTGSKKAQRGCLSEERVKWLFFNLGKKKA